MDIYLIRHTTPDIKKGICYGATDLPVANSFEEEATAVQQVLPPFTEKTLVISSPLQRCKQLAAFIAPPSKVEVDIRFKEISFGDWELQAWNAIDKSALKSWFSQFVAVGPPNGESFQAVHDRCMAAYQEAQSKAADQLWIVAHSGIIRAILANLQKSPLKDAFKPHMDFGVVFKIASTNKVIQVK